MSGCRRSQSLGGDLMSGLLDCRHKPSCPLTAGRWQCGLRTRIEAGVNQGLITREDGRLLLQHYGLPMTPLSKVYKGEPTAGPEQGRLV